MKGKVELTLAITCSALKSECKSSDYPYYIGLHGLQYLMDDVPDAIKRNPEFLTQLFVVYGTRIDESSKWYIALCAFFTQEQIVLAKECADLYISTYNLEYTRYLNVHGIEIYQAQYDMTYSYVYSRQFKLSYDKYSKVNDIRAKFNIEIP